jgi:hypothetical protein
LHRFGTNLRAVYQPNFVATTWPTPADAGTPDRFDATPAVHGMVPPGRGDSPARSVAAAAAPTTKTAHDRAMDEPVITNSGRGNYPSLCGSPVQRAATRKSEIRARGQVSRSDWRIVDVRNRLAVWYGPAAAGDRERIRRERGGCSSSLQDTVFGGWGRVGLRLSFSSPFRCPTFCS